jgi:hypothetical protein
MRGDEIHLWEVGASKPVIREDGLNKYPSYTNLRFAVVARTMERVMDMAVEQYGADLCFHTIVKRNYMGEAKVLIDPEVT